MIGHAQHLTNPFVDISFQFELTRRRTFRMLAINAAVYASNPHGRISMLRFSRSESAWQVPRFPMLRIENP